MTELPNAAYLYGQDQINFDLFPKTITFYGQENVVIPCALCATKGKTTNIYIDSNTYYSNRYGTACHDCVSSEFKKEERSTRDEHPYHSEYLPPKKLCDMTWDELVIQEQKDILLENIKVQEITKLIERNASVARQIALSVPDTEEQRAKYKKIFTNKGPWKREITGQILESDFEEKDAAWYIDEIVRNSVSGKNVWTIS
jgi:hypothetical protein